MIEHSSNIPSSSLLGPNNGLGPLACYDTFENKPGPGIGIAPSIPNAHYLAFRTGYL